MKRISRFSIAISACLVLLAAGCARQPDNKRCAEVIKKSFKKYGKKYPATIFGQQKIKDVEITSKQEIHKKLVSVQAFLTMTDGTVQRIEATLERGPAGWRFVSWEDSTGS